LRDEHEMRSARSLVRPVVALGVMIPFMYPLPHVNDGGKPTPLTALVAIAGVAAAIVVDRLMTIPRR
jgi:hypothetical protein